MIAGCPKPCAKPTHEKNQREVCGDRRADGEYEHTSVAPENRTPPASGDSAGEIPDQEANEDRRHQNRLLDLRNPKICCDRIRHRCQHPHFVTLREDDSATDKERPDLVCAERRFIDIFADDDPSTIFVEKIPCLELF